MQLNHQAPPSSAQRRRSLVQARHLVWLACLGLLSVWLTPACSTPVCRSNDDCKAPTPHCVLAQCQACTEDSHCKANQRCDRQGGVCRSTSEATPEKDGGPDVPGVDTPNPDVPIGPERPVDTVTQDNTPDVPSGTCNVGEVRQCYPAPAETRGKGPCVAGTQACSADGRWGSCRGAILPQPERCDGQDNDCNGKVDDKWPTLGQGCTTGSGDCLAKGTFVCPTDGKSPVVCNAKPPQASTEVCDGKDNNCDGKIDETFPDKGKACANGIGACRASGKLACRPDAKGLVCDAKPTPGKPETCNNIDDDCDGTVDEGITCPCKTGETRKCGNGRGECKEGTQTCTNGTWSSTCVGAVGPKTETCNNKDDDCDGSVDEALSRPCFPTGRSGCVRSGGSYQCKGKCVAGVQSCQSGRWRTCAGAIYATTERCNGIDDDCDGRVDENYNNLGKSCNTGTGECQGTGKYVCNSSGSTTTCDAKASSAKPEVCDGKDNDCDGRIDDNTTDSGGACTDTTKEGECAKGTNVCSKGKLVCQSSTFPRTEACDGKDNDCDGQIDDNVPGTGVPCGSTGGCQSTIRCDNGQMKCIPSSTAGIETCRDSIDNDCDGNTDEICGPRHKWAVTNASGSRVAGNLSVNRLSTGRIRTGQSCTSNPIFAVAHSNASHSVTYDCTSNNRYTVYIHNDAVSGTNFYEDTPISVVVPTRGGGEVFGIVDELGCHNSTNKRCSLDEDQGIITVREMSTGVYELSSPGCNNANQPIFVMPHRDNRTSRTTYTVRNVGGKCLVNIYDNNGAPVSNRFAFWLPRSTNNAWAATTTSGLAASQNFGDQNAKWAWKANGTTNKTYDVTFHAWAKPSAVLVSPIYVTRSPPPTRPSQILSILPITGGVTVHPFDEGVGTPVVAPLARFYVIFVQ